MTDSRKIRARFAPSPGGLLDVGNARTALFNWLFARHAGGDFIVRMEDAGIEGTETRSGARHDARPDARPNARQDARNEAQILADLRWLGLEWDEGPGESGDRSDKGKGAFGPYRQSERMAIYEKHTHKLLAEEKAYRCFCTAAELAAERKLQEEKRPDQVFRCRCRKLSVKTIRKNADSGMAYTVRLKGGEQPLRFHDLIRGGVEFPAENLSDPILVRAGHKNRPGMPVYNYAVTIDDALMEITHVIRGDDLIANTPQQVAIYEAFDWKAPEFAHLPPIVGADRELLSKRHGATSISAFREMGYLPEAVANSLALLGLGAEDGKTGALSLPDLAKAFTLERVSPSPAVFDFGTLNGLNRQVIRTATPVRLAALAWEYFGGLLPAKIDSSDEVIVWFVALVQLFAPAVDHLDQMMPRALFLFGFRPEEARAQQENAAVLAADSAGNVLSELAARVRARQEAVTAGIFKEWMSQIGEALGIHGNELFQPVRIALTGTYSGAEFDKLIPLIELGATLNIGVPSVRARVDKFVGA
ncbi:MAG TPA: glutamate--tRNA ligase [Terracidiphilus sp.]|nr:glutamate--tRNA ligase [Terracidiphilus sp.]